MAEASGWGIIPVTVSMAGATKELNKQLVGPAKKAGKDAGDGIEKGVAASAKKAASAVEKASDQQVRARDRAADAADKTKLAELKLSEVLDKSDAKASEIANATGRLEKARRDQARADKAAETATENLADAQKRLDKAQQQAQGSGLEVSASMTDVKKSAGDAGGSLDSLVGKLGGLAGAAAGIGSIGAVIAEGFDMQTSIDMMNNQLGLTGAAAQEAADEVSAAMRGGVAGGVDEATEAVGSLQSQFKYLGFDGEQTAGQLSDNFLAFTKTFGVDMQEATQMAGQLVKNGLATDVEDAADLMTASFQRVPAAMRDEMPEILNEYGQNFKNLGFSGEQAFSLLVAQAEKGKFALDKTGDALKEFTIRGSDMSKSSVDAYDAIGLSAEEMSDKIVQGGPGAQEALKQVAQGILAISDPAEQSNTAIALFGTQMEDLGVDQVPEFMDAIAQGTDGLTDFKGSSQELADQMANSLQGRMNALKGTAQELAGQGFMKMWDIGQKVVQVFKDWAPVIVPLGTSLAVLAAGLGAVALQQSIVAAGGLLAFLKNLSVVTKIATGAQAAFNAVMAANPLVLIAIAIAALVAGLVVFFTKTETGKKVWEGFMDVLKGVWSWIKDTFGPVFSWLGDVIGAAWDGIKGYFEWGWNNLKTVFGYIADGWKVVWGGIQSAWESVGKPVVEFLVQYFQWGWDNLKTVFDFIGQAWSVLWDGVTTAWNSVIQPVLDALWTVVSTTLGVIGTVILAPLLVAWNLLSAGISWAWENLIKPAWDNLSTVITWLWENVLQPIFGWIKDRWDEMALGIQITWDTIIKPAWDALSAAASWLWNNVLSPVFGWIKDKWDDMSRGIQVIWENVIRPVWDALGQVISFVVENVAKPAFQALKDALSSVGDFFSSIVDGIKGVWNSLKSALAKPINFMINTVYNGGILKAWNSVAKFIPGLNQASPLSGIAENATGGAIRGPGTGTSDDILSWLSNGEHVLTAADVKAMGGQAVVYQLRALLEKGEKFTWDHGRLYVDGQSRDDNGPLSLALPAFAKGGDINDGRPAWEAAVEKGHEWAQQQNGKPYLTGSQWPAGGDCSGFMSAIASVILGAEPNAGHWATPAFPAGQGGTVHAGNQTWDPGLSQGFSIGVKGGPDSGGQNGHTAGTLSSAGNFSSVNVESGGGHGGVAYGGPAAGADSGQFPGVWHLPIGADGDFESAGSVSPAKKKQFLRDKVKDVFDSILSPIDGMFSSMVGDPPPEWFGIPPKAMHGSKDKIVDFLFDRIEDLGNLLGKAYDSAKKIGDAIGNVAEDIGKGTLHVLSGGRLFDTGGMLASGGTAVNKSGKPERILSPDQTETFEKLLEILPGLLDGSVSVDAAQVLAEASATFGEKHPDVAGEISASMSDSALDFFGLKVTWMVDPEGALGISVDNKQKDVSAADPSVDVPASAPVDTAPVSDTGDYSPMFVDLDEVDPHRHDKPEGPAGYVFGIVQSAQDHSLPASGARIGVATALVEAGDPLQMWANNSVPESLNYPHDAVGSDADSIGLFQQRDNGAWGTVAQRMDPHDSADMFFDAMLSKFPDWQSMDPGAVAQGVQVSAFPDRYNTKMSRAEELVAEAGLYDQGGILPDGALAVNLSGSPEHVFTDNAMSNFVDATESLEEATTKLEKLANGLSLAKPAEVPVMVSGEGSADLGDSPSVSAAQGGKNATGGGMVVNLTMENVQAQDPAAASREVMREAKRVLAQFA
jgi:phage-related minor tail protein